MKEKYLESLERDIELESKGLKFFCLECGLEMAKAEKQELTELYGENSVFCQECNLKLSGYCSE